MCMMNRKTTYLLLAGLLTLAACDNDDNGTTADPKAYPLVVTAQQFDYAEDSEGSTYTKGETLGVYMLEAGTDNIVPPYGNLRYYANRYEDEDYFLPGSNDSIPYFPATGEKRDVSAYYPKTVTLADSLVNIHLVEHYDYASQLLWARVSGLDKDNRKAVLNLRPALTLLSFNLKAGFGVSADDLQGALVILRGLPVSGYFNAVNGRVTYHEGITQDLVYQATTKAATRSLLTRADSDDEEEEDKTVVLTVAAMVLPTSTTEGFKMIVEVPKLEQTYEYDIPEGTGNFVGATEYPINIEINNEGMIVTVEPPSPIDNWTPGGTISGEGEEVTE